MNRIPSIPPLSLSVWPYDTCEAPDSIPTEHFRLLRCFVLCPFDRAGTILPMIRAAAAQVQGYMNHAIQVYYAGDMVGPSAIHPDIWTHISQADLIIADITGYNPNVVYELGVAAAWRSQSSVIIVRDRRDGSGSVFDLSPARQIVYESTKEDWMATLQIQLSQAIFKGLAPVPFLDEPHIDVPAQFTAKLANGTDTRYLWSPGPGHRRMVQDGLEFGSPFFFPYSWLSPPGLRPENIEVEAEMRFSFRLEHCWIGIALRSQGYLADNEHLAWLNESGLVNRTGPSHGASGKDEHRVGQLPDFDPSDTGFVRFRVSIDDRQWVISVGDLVCEVPLSEMPHVFTRGRVMFQSFQCRAVIRRVRIAAL